MIIESGTGNGRSAGVNTENRMEVAAVVDPRVADISKREGRAFIIASDFVALTTTGSFNGMLYIKNASESRTLFIQRIRVCHTHTGSSQMYLVRNPTAGTLISEMNPALQYSSNLNSVNAFEGDAYSAAGDGKTVTDGDNFSNFINRSPGHSIQEYGGLLVLPRGAAFALTLKPDAATTACIEAQCWFELD